MRTKGFLVTAAMLVLSLGGMVSLIDSGYEITQMRNAFIASRGVPADFDWTPERPPEGFLWDQGPAPRGFREQAAAILSEVSGDGAELRRALSIAHHLSEGPGRGGGIRASTEEAYRTIRTEPRGYCADYTQVMNGFGLAARIPVREWGLSFDDYSGRGHAFTEVYDSKLSQWVFLDSFYSFYVLDRATDRPLSVLELRERLAAGEGSKSLEVRRINPERFGFKSAEKALEYYRRGTEGFFLYFGTNVFGYDQHPVVAALGRLSRALEESAGIVFGVRPGIRIVPTPTNSESIANLLFRRNLFLFLAGVALLCGLVFARMAWRAIRGGRVDGVAA